MKRYLLTILLLVSPLAVQHASDTIAYESITINIAAAVALTAANYASTYSDPPPSALITVETAQIRFRTDGSAPTSTVGHVAEIGDRIQISGLRDLKNFQAISTHATSSATVRVSYYR